MRMWQCIVSARQKPALPTYNQQATTNVISIFRQGQEKLSDNSRCEAFLDRIQIPEDDRTGFVCLPRDKLYNIEEIAPLYEEAKRC